jgi:tetratricopeptide (TPR) repeat protein
VGKRINLEAWHGRSLFLLFAWAALALGSARPWAIAVTTGLALLAYVVGRAERGWTRHGSRLDGIGLALVALTSFTFLQLVPLPAGLVAALSPRAFELHDAAWTALGTAHRGGWFPLSLDPPATALAALALLAVTFTYLTVRFRLRLHGGRAVLNPLVAAGAVVAVVFFLHQLAGWDKVYDEYAPRYVGLVPLPAPFLNANHLAGALGFFAALSFGLALSTVDRYRRLTLILAGAITGGGCLLTLSRGGILAFVAGQVLFLVLRLANRGERRRKHHRSTSSSAPPEPDVEPAAPDAAATATATDTATATAASTTSKHDEPRQTHLAWATLGVLLAVTAGSYVAYDAIVGEFEGGDTSKWELARDAFAIAGDHPWTGIGRGAYLAASPPYASANDASTFTHPENFVAQYLAEWGVPLGGLAVLGLLFVLGRAVLRPPLKPHNAAAIAAVFALLLQNTVDFGLELLGLALPFIAALAVVREVGAVGDGRQVRRPSHPRVRLPAVSWMLPVAGTVVALALLYPWAAANELEVESDRYRLFASTRTYHPGLSEDARGAFARHPADYYLPLQAGVHLARTGGGSPVPFWNQALRIHPCSSVTHFALGTYFARLPGGSHRAQAIGEFALAVRCRPALLPPAAAIVARLLPRFEDASGFALLAAADPLPLWNALAAAWESLGNTTAAAAADEALLARRPDDMAARFRRARAALAAGAPEQAERQLAAAGPGAEREAPYYLLGAQALAARDRPDEAAALLRRGIERSADPALPATLAELHASAGDYDAAEEALAVLEARARTQQDRSDAVARRIQLLVRVGRVADALAQTRRALGIDPGRIDLWNTAAGLAEQLGDTTGMVWALRELCRRQPKDQALRERLRRAESRATELRLLRP